MLSQSKTKLITSIKKSIWTMNKIISMIEEEKYCADIAQQINASIWLLKKANNDLLEQHLNCCWINKLSSKNESERQDFIKELVRVRDVSKRN